MKTLIDGVNEVLKKASIVDNNGLLASLTNPGKQVFIDHAISAWNEVIDELFSAADVLKPLQAGESSITLAATREYSLATDLVDIRWPLRDETNGQYIEEYDGGIEGLRKAQAFENETGLPRLGVIDPLTGGIFLDTTPTISEIGRIYKYLYWKDTVLVSATDQMPFSDAVFRAMVPAVAEYWSLYQKKDFKEALFKASIGRSVRLMRKTPQRDSWIERGSSTNSTDPLSHAN